MKAIYTKVGDSYYKLDADTTTPSNIIGNDSGTSSSITTEVANRTFAQTMTLNSLEGGELMSNKELYDEFITYLKENEITSLKTIPASYKLYIDYSMYYNGKEIEHSSVMQPVGYTDMIYPLGVSKDNETVYRRISQINKSLEFRLKVNIPHGISQSISTTQKYGFKINNVSLYYDTLNGADDHESTYCNGYNGAHDIIPSSQETLIKAYSTADEGYNFAVANINYFPRKIVLNVKIILGNLIVAYSDEEVESIIGGNKNAGCECCDCNKKKANYIVKEKPEGGCERKKLNGHIVSTRKDANRPAANGQTVPDENGMYDMYEKCSPINPDGLLVVTDNTADSIFDEPTMVRYSDVVADIPDIQVGDFVVYLTVQTEE